MAERSENVISWNVPNVVTIWLMLALLWVALGVVSHFVWRKPRSGNGPAAQSKDNAGNVVGTAA